MSRHTKRREAPGNITVMLLGVLASALITALLSLIFSFIAYSMTNPDAAVGIFSLATLIITAAITGFTLSRVTGDGGVLLSALSALLFTLILFLIGLIAGGGSIPLGCIINYICYIAVSLLSALLGRKRRRIHR